jgi:hypothetical protein
MLLRREKVLTPRGCIQMLTEMDDLGVNVTMLQLRDPPYSVVPPASHLHARTRA